MLLPIGHDTGTVRRDPWVTYILMALCLGAFLYTNSVDRELSERHLLKVKEGIQYFAEHPYLQPPAEMEPWLGSDWEGQRKQLMDLREQSGQSTRTIPPFMREQQQDELDAIVAEAVAVRNEHPFYKWGLVTGQASLVGAFGYMFLHGGWMHLLGNMLLLFLTGSFIEDRWGRPVYLAFYLLSGLVAAGLFMSRFPDLTTPLVGASGAVAGCMGAFLVRFWRAKLRYLCWFVVVGFTFSAPAWLMLPLWFGGEFLMARLSEAANPTGGAGVAYWAHVGGFGFGVIAALGMRALHFEERWMDSVVDRKIGVVHNEGVEAAMALAEEGDSEQAFEVLSREVKRNPRNREAAQALWDVAGTLGRAAQVAPHMLRLIRDEIRAGETDLAVQHWIEFAQRAERLPVDPALALRLAPDLAKQDKEPLAADVIERALDSPDTTPTVALRLARLARDLDARVCARAARIALRSQLAEETREAGELLETVGAPVEEPEAPVLEAGAALDLPGMEDEPIPDFADALPGADAEYDGAGSRHEPLDLDEDADLPAAVGVESPAPARRAAAPAPPEPAALDATPLDPGDDAIDEDVLSDADLDDIDLDGLDLAEVDAEAGLGPITEDAPPPLADPEPVVPAAATPPPSAAAAAPPGEPDVGAEPGTFDPSALELETRPGSAVSNPALEDFGVISLDPEPAPVAEPDPELEVEEAAAPPPPRPLRVMDAVPVRLRDDAISLEVDGRGKTRLRFERIEAVAAGAVRGLGAKPVLVVDLALNWTDPAGRPLQVVRLRSDRFDPRRLVDGETKPLDALRRLVETLLDAAGAVPLPDRDGACGRPRFAAHESLEAYERSALGGTSS